ncbi:hypothetical protein HPB49_000369 [Dermacentor silvarum]|uniref:Uncharacterized protein n=1 Tax=Dermacentor silvarum TaxID=543639 RepID=A0ACB8D1M7_DERSI|nr:hypothetical protein HPB49_000369 [Dermacentor silvarum]
MQAHGGGHGKTRHRDPNASSGRRLRGTASPTPPDSRRRAVTKGETAGHASDGDYDDQHAPDNQMGPEYQEGTDYRTGPDYQEAPDDGGREQGDEADQSNSSSDYYDGPHRRRSRRCCPGKCACCIALVAVVVLAPLLYFMFPYIKANIEAAFVGANDTALTPSTTLSTSRITSTSPLTTSTTSSTTVKSTENAREKIEKDCVKESPSHYDATTVANAAPPAYLPAAPAGGPQPIYCLYNVTRLPRVRFLPLHLPLAMCPSVVYWSWRLPGGVLKSRAENFDKTYGLGAIRFAARDQKVHVEVLLALGGFREDSADFYKVGRDPITRQRLVQALFSATTLYNLSGITLHWLPNSRDCEDFYGGGVPQLSDFVSSVRRLVSLNVPSVPFKVAAMVDPQEKSEMEFFRALRSYLNLTFFNTHHHLQSDTFASYCANSVPVFQSQEALLRAVFQEPALRAASPPLDPFEGLCVSFSLALHARQGDNISKPAAAQPASATTGYMAMFEVCNSQAKFNIRVPIVSGCIVKRTGPPLDVMIAYDDVGTLREKMSYFGSKEDLCVMLYDVDFDNYQNGCAGHSELFLMMQHFYSARDNLSTFNLVSYLP